MWIPKSRTLVRSIWWQITGWVLCSAWGESRTSCHSRDRQEGGNCFSFPSAVTGATVTSCIVPDPSRTLRRRNNLQRRECHRIASSPFPSVIKIPPAVLVDSAWIPIWGARGKAELDRMAVIKSLSHHVTPSKHSPSLLNNERLLVPAN